MTPESTPARAAAPAGADAMAVLAVLGDESRRRLLEFVRRARRPVTREEASEAVGISRKLAAFHLDKLVASGLLQARHGGHGPRRVGRAPKVYEPSPHALAVSLPPRRHELLAALLAEAAATQRPPESAREAALRVAGERGRALGAEAGGKDVTAFLEETGFEPTAEDDGRRTVLHNCPFHPVAAQAPELVCGMNHAFLCGYLAACGNRETTAVLAPRAGACCVELRTGGTEAADADGEPRPEAGDSSRTRDTSA
ncbi:helix-turn-helix transcriptional regulator [Streptomyces triticisoli]|uniref:helix-turn-helix transcriptional regulator n=1 Tax=Streptomyces triticisoli TaxID=2182797 RepID=UPI001E35CDE7|nr:helix-turn-helix domain-containing protein [Streptomyces triticisoli]